MAASADEKAVTIHLPTQAEHETIKVDKGKGKVTSLNEGGAKYRG